MSDKRKANATAASKAAAEQLQQAIRALGSYAHVDVQARGGHLVISTDGDPVARLTPISNGRYGLSFHNHTGRWEPMPFTDDLLQQAQHVVTVLGVYLECWELPGGNSGSGH